MDQIKKILVPVDFSTNSTHALQYAELLARQNNASITVLHVLFIAGAPHTRIYTTMLEENMTENAKAGCSRMISSVKKGTSDTLNIDYVILENGLPADEITMYAGHHQFDLIVMGTKGASGIQELFMGSVTASVIRKTGVPVLAVPHEYRSERPDSILLLTYRFEENKALLDTVISLAKMFSATVHVAVFEDADTAKAVEYIDDRRRLEHYMQFIRKTYPGIEFREELLAGNDFEEAVEEYDKRNGVDMVAMITYPKKFLERWLQKNRTRKMAFHSRIPILAIPVV
ncbi:MAG: universal stress protein [Chitinophagaceae bacterium]|nr:universal stress protein [Chitinophagaceae bacterium]